MSHGAPERRAWDRARASAYRSLADHSRHRPAPVAVGRSHPAAHGRRVGVGAAQVGLGRFGQRRIVVGVGRSSNEVAVGVAGVSLGPKTTAESTASSC